MTSDPGQPAQTLASIGIDIGKDVFHIVGFDATGKVIRERGMSASPRSADEC